MKIAAFILVALALAGCASPRTDWAGISTAVGQVTK
jgi:outer membrane murein-binding lipoprotein Lpp